MNTKYRKIFYKGFGFLIATIIFLIPIAGRTETGSIILFSAQFDLDRLAPETTTGEAVFYLDESDSIKIDVNSNIGDLTIRIKGPNNEIIDTDTIAAFGGEFTMFGEPVVPDSQPILPFHTRGFHYLTQVATYKS